MSAHAKPKQDWEERREVHTSLIELLALLSHLSTAEVKHRIDNGWSFTYQQDAYPRWMDRNGVTYHVQPDPGRLTELFKPVPIPRMSVAMADIPDLPSAADIRGLEGWR